MTFNQEVGRRIRYARKRIGMTMKELGEKVDLSEGNIQRYEAGKIKGLDVNLLKRISQVLHCSEKYLMGWEENLTTDNAYFQVELLEKPNVMNIAKKLIHQPDDIISNVDNYIDFIVEQKNKD